MPIIIIEKPSKNFLPQEIQPKYIILHCIGFIEEYALNLLTQTIEEGGGGVSAHYFIPQIELSPLSAMSTYPVYRLVEDTKFARHAGKSQWQTDLDLNDQSIGIEFSSPNYANALEGGALDWFHFEKFPPSQIMAGIELIKSLIEQYNIQPENILCHSDIAPWRLNAEGDVILGKTDPGATFPWQMLAQHGIGVWPKTERKRTTPINLSIESIQSLLLAVGYPLDQTGMKDLKTSHAIKAFQLHFLPKEVGTEPSASMVTFLENLIDKHYEYTPFLGGEEHNNRRSVSPQLFVNDRNYEIAGVL